ncbi:hypothetical protein [Sphingomonas sp. DT-204]|uniref:hypothetical protein n=1 Tax=Sphingomonas sp. DT-204 TaxID=3396166 RepID=UPI003F1D3A9E
MSQDRTGERVRNADGGDRGAVASLGAADRLSLAAAPAFAAMALLGTRHGGGPADILCSAAHDGSPLGGMVPMYVLMSIFHSAPWLRLIATRRRDARALMPPSS